eukprot:12590471-Heterocapsa_arctica.AAC.1
MYPSHPTNFSSGVLLKESCIGRSPEVTTSSGCVTHRQPRPQNIQENNLNVGWVGGQTNDCDNVLCKLARAKMAT